MSVKERLGFSAKPTAPVEKVSFYLLLTSSWFSFGISLLSYLANGICYDFSFSLQVFSTSVGLTKTVYNPAALKAVQKSSEEALKKKQVRRTRGNREKSRGWMNRRKATRIVILKRKGSASSFPIITLTGSSKATAGCEEEEAGNTGEAHRDTEGKITYKGGLFYCFDICSSLITSLH